MNTRINAWDRMMGAVTFAEAGEAGTAKAILAQKSVRQQPTLNLWDRMMAAVTFAEAGETETALQIMNRKSLQDQAHVRKQADNRPRLQA
ncbi:MAG: hypothetical protein OEY01_03905 [Desulfobulbaceae bacterium]|nr:hypothetical protein [Desulfobulbaceae bacterium]HIJ78329.1 hypothetical protein [Deltaproteobacteria bacterium]